MARTRAAQEAEKKSLPPPQTASASRPASTILPSPTARSTTQTTQPDGRPSTEPQGHRETTQSAQSQGQKKPKPRWDAFSRYFSDNISSFPDYGAPQVMKSLKTLNASAGGPVNTMSGQSSPAARSSAQSSSQPASRSKGPRASHSSPIVVELAAPNSNPQPIKHRVPDNGSRIPVIKSSRPPGNAATKTYSKRAVKPTRPPYFASVDRQPRRERDPSIHSVEDDDRAFSQPAKESNRQKRNASPDVIAVDDLAEADPPPANIISDLTTAKRPRPAQLLSRRPEKRAKRTKAASPEEPDELQVAQERARVTRTKRLEDVEDDEEDGHSRSDITSSYFTSPTRRTGSTGASVLKVTKAAAGNNCYLADGDQRGPVRLRADFDKPWLLRAVGSNDHIIEDLTWMDINLRAIQSLLYSDSCHVQVKQSMTPNHPSPVVFQFDSSADVVNLVSNRNFSPRRAELKPPLIMKNIVRTGIRESSNRHHSRKDAEVSRSLSGSPKEGSPGRRSASPRIASDSGSRRKDEQASNEKTGQARSNSSQRLARRASDSHSVEFQGFHPRRSRRSAPSVLVDEDPIRWTDQNHEWAKEFQQSLIYPPTGKNRTTVDKDDIYRLDDGEFLNDNLINFWIRYLQHTLEAENPAMLKRVYFFSTFFFEKLRYSNGRIDYDGVKSWTSKVDVFSYDYLVVPVNENAHWYLAIVCKPGKLLPQVSGSDKEAEEPSPTPAKVAVIGKQLSEVRLADANAQSTEPNFPEQHPPGFSGRTDQDRCVKEAMEKQVTIKSKQDPDRPRIVTLDSLGSAHPKTCGALKTYLIAEAKDKKKLDDITLPSGFTAKSIPQQDNWCDCGIYVLAYVEQFLQSPDESLQRILLKEPTGWKVHAPEKRKSIRQLIFVLQKRQQEEAELEKAAKQARRRAKVKAKEAAVPANAVTELRESVEGDTTSVLKGVNGQPPRQADAKASNSQRNTVELTYGSPRRANGLLAVSEPVSQGRSPERDGSKGPSSSNSFHTANSSPALGDSTETGFQASEAKPDKLDQSGEVEIRLSPSRKEEVVMIEGLPSSPSSTVQNVETPSAKKRKRKRSQGPDVSPAAPLRRRKLVEQIADSRTTPKESIEVQDDDNSQPESGAKYDGIDRRRAD